MKRPRNHTIAAVIQFAASVFSVVTGAQALMPGSSIAEVIPFPVLLLGFALGAIGLVSAYGIWQNQRWGVILTIVIRALDGLSAAPGILFAPNPMLKTMASLGVVISIVVIALLLWPKPRPVTA